MKWRSEDIDLYLQSEEYVDTAIVPLIPISMGKQMKHTVLKGEFPLIVTDELERQLKGRVILFPPITYLSKESDDSVLSRMIGLRDELIEQGIPYITFVTSDARWSGVDELNPDLINIPPVPLEHMEDEYKRDVIGEQVKHLLQIVTKKWQNTKLGE
ncbi:YpiF family protein [Alkalihalobacillus sp. AL-G]|uniref:YpiF family protein n=1 Tax=Alkalihalobacillus sp. AL-G TaxID=2926399 RepID=UPI00272DA306|nr:YpiF family protein [Alkalihalobacillus sp. AL-G]WLD91814.1 YpiF family protein [Alkalihalobacillus sp. AL-G]